MSEEEIPLPSNIQAEAALLGALMVSNDILDVINQNLKEEHFYEGLHGRIFAAIKKCVSDGISASPITLRPLFQNDETIKELGGVGYLIKMTADGAGLIGAKDLAQQIYDLSILRDIALIGIHLNKAANDTSESICPRERLEEAQDILFSLDYDGDEKETFHISGAVSDVIKDLEQEAKGEGEPPIKPNDIEDWNNCIDGMAAGDLTILAGRPGMFKTGMALNICLASAKDGYPTDFFSLEMTKRQLVVRSLCHLSFDGIGHSPKSNNVKNWNLTNKERSAISRAGEMLSKSDLTIHTDHHLTIPKLAAKIRKSKRNWDNKGKKLRLVVIDYLQLMTSENRHQNKTQEISEISRGLKSLAKKMDVHIIALSQLSRAVEQREDKRPILSDLRDSGSIEQDADNVVFLYREHYYIAQEEPKGKDASGNKWEDWKADYTGTKNEMDLIARKTRSTEPSSKKCKVYLEYQAVRDFNWADKGKMV